MIGPVFEAATDRWLRHACGAARGIAAVAMLAGALCTAPRVAHAQITITGSNGYTLNWNGNQYWNSTVPTNLASASGTANAFGSGQFNTGIHAIVNINDGLYGNSESWINGAATPYYIGIRFPQAADLSSIAWSRDNASAALTDRSVGTYTIQFTTVASPGTSTASGDWTTIGTVALGAASGSYVPYQRHEYTLANSSGGPITGVTGIRILTFDGACLDEISTFRQVYRTAGSGNLYAANSFSTAVTGGTTTTPYVGDILAFSATTSATQAITLGGTSQNARAMRFSTSDAVTFTAGGTNGTLSLGYLADIATGTNNAGAGNRTTSGGTMLTLDAGAGAVTIGSSTSGQQVAIALNASNTWVNNSANTLTVNNGVSRFSTDGTSRTLTVSGSGATTIAGAITNGGTAGSLALAKTDAGTLTLSGSSSYTGGTTVTGGKLVANGWLAAGATTVSGGGVLAGSGTVGAVTVSSGGVIAPGNSPGTLTTGAMTWGGGGFYDWQLYDAAGSAGTGWDFISGTGGLTINSTSGSKFTINLLTLSSTAPDASGNALNFDSATSGTWALATFTSITGFDPSVLALNAAGFTNPMSGLFSLATSGGTLNLVYSLPVDYTYTAGEGTWSTAANWSGETSPSGAAALTFTGTGGTTTNDIPASTLSGIAGITFTGTAGGYTVAGPLPLGGAVTNDAPATQTLAGDVSLLQASSLNAAAGGIVITGTVTTNGNALTTLGSGTVTVGGGGTSGAIAGAFTNNGVLAFNRSDAFTESDAISGTGSLVKLNTNALTLSASNSYSGGTTLAAGRLNIGNASALGSGTFTIAGSGTIDNSSGGAITLSANNPQAWNGNFTFAGSNPLNLGTGTVTLSANSQVTVTASTLTVGGAIGGAFSLTKAGAGTLTLSGSNSYSGGTTLSAGRLNVNNASALGTGTFTIAGSGTFDNTSGGAIALSTNNPQAWNADFTFAGSNPLNFGTGTVSFSATRSVTVTSSTLTAGGAYGGSSTLTKAGAGTLAMTGISTHSGTISLNAGTLQLGNTGTAGRSNVVMAASTTLQLTGTAASIGTLSGTTATSTALGAATLTVNQASDQSYYGTISGSGGLTLSGVGAFPVLRFLAQQSYTGTTTITAGYMTAQVDNALAPQSVVSMSGGNLDIWSRPQTIAGLGGSGGKLYSSSGSTGVLTLNVAGGSSFSFGGVLGDPGATTFSVVKSGSGTQVFTASNSYTAGTTLNSGTLGFANNALGTSGTVRLNGGVLRWESGNVQDLSGRLALVSGSTATLDTNGNNVTLATGFGGNTSAGLVKLGSGTLTLSGSNSYTGPTVAGAGVLQFATKAALYGGGTSSWVPDNINVKSGATLALDVGGTDEFGTADVATLLVNLASSTSATSGLNAGATIGFDTSNAVGGSFTVATAVANTTGAAGGAIGLVKLGSGTLTLSATNSYSGGTTLNAGTLLLGNTAALGSTAGALAVNGGTLDLGGNSVAVGLLSGSSGATITSNVAGLATLTGSSASSSTYAGAIADGTGKVALAKSGAGTLTLSASNSYSGGTTLNAGQLNINNASALGTGTFTIAGSATIDNTSGAAITLATNNAQTWSANFTFAGSNPLTMGTGTVTMGAPMQVTVTSSTLTAGGLAGSSTLTKAGAGTLALTGSSTHTGQITVSAGRLQLGNTGTAARSNLSVAAGATLALTGTAASIGNVVSNSGSIVLGNATLTINQVADQTFSGVISGSGGIVQSGASNLRLTGSSTYTGPTVVNAGILVLQGAANRLSPSTVVYLNGGQIDLNDKVQTWAGVSGSAGANIYSYNTTAGSLVLNVASGTSYTYAGTLGTVYSGYSVVKNGGGTQVFTGANVYTQGTTLNSGTLGFANNSLGTSGTVTLNGGVLRWQSGNTQDLSGRLRLVSGSTATLDTNGNDVTFATSFGGTTSAALSKIGAGTLTLSASNSYSGGTTLNAGVLAFGTNALGSSGAVTLNGGTLRWATGNTSDISGRLALVSGSTATLDTNGNNVTLATGFGGSTSAALVKAGAGTLTLTGTTSYTGGTTISGGTLQVGAGSTAGWIAGDVTTNAALAFNRSDNVTYANVISGTGRLLKSGAGRLNLTGANTLSGATTVSTGTLAVNGSLAGSAITVSGGALGGSGTVGVVTIAAGGTIAPGNSPGTLTTGAMTWAGGGAYDWQLYDATGSAGTGWDFISGSGALTINATSGNKFTLNLLTLSGINPDVPGDALNFNSATSGTWALGSFTSITGFDPSAFSINTSGFTNPRTGGFAVTTSGGTLNLVYDIFTSYEYTGGTGNWSTAGNWLGGSTPNGTAAITFSGTSGGTATNDISTATLPVVYGITFSSTAGAYTVAGPIPLGVGGVVNNSAVVQTLSGSVSLGGSSVVNAAAGGITLTGTLATNGNPFAVAGTGTVSIGAGGTSGALVGDVVNNGRLAFNRSDALTYSGNISGAGSITKLASGTLTLSGSNSHSGGTTLSAGRLNVNNASALGTGTFTIAGATTIDNTSGSAITLSTNTPQAWNADFTFAGTNPLNLGTGTVGFSATRTVTVTSSTLTAGGAYGGSSTLTKAGAGTLALTGSSTHTGTVNVNAGRLQLGNTGTAGRSNFVMSANTTLELTGTAASIGNLAAGAGATSASVALGNATLTINQAADQYYYGTFTGSGGIVKAGTLHLRLMTPSTYSGSTVVESSASAVLVLQGSSNILPTSTVVTLNSGQIDLSNFTQTWSGLAGTGGNIYSYTGTGTPLVLNVASGTSYTFAGTLSTGNASPNYSLVKNGAGTQVLTGASTYSAGTTLNSGTLGFANNSLGTAGTVTLNGGVLRWETNNTQDLSARLRLVSGSTATLDTNGNNVAFATSFGGTTSAALVKQGAGTLTLSASNSYTGGSTITGGTVVMSGANSAGTGQVTLNGGAVSGTFNGSFANAVAIGAGGGTIAGPTLAQNFYTTFSGSLSGSGALTVSNLVQLSNAANSYSGPITVLGGNSFLRLAASNVLADAVDITLSGTNSSLRIDGGVTETIDILAGSAGSVVFSAGGAASLRVGSTGGSGTYSGVLQNSTGTLSLAQIGSGTLTLNRPLGNGEAVGGVEVSAGRLVLSGTGISFNAGYFTGTTPLTARSGGTLELAANWITSSSNAITADGGTVLLSNGSVNDAGTYINTLTLKDGGVLSGNAPRVGYFGDATITVTGSIASSMSAGMLLVRNTGSSNSLSVNVADVTGNATADLTISGNITNDGTYLNMPVVKTGAGTLELSGNNSFGGSLAVREGTLSIASINNAGANGVLGNSANAVTLGGTAGTLGTLAYTGASASSTKPFTLATGGTGGFSVATGANLTLSGSIDGGGGLLKTGLGTLTLSASNTYSGPTTIASGTIATGTAGAISAASAITIGSATGRGALLVNQALTMAGLTFSGSGGDVADGSLGMVTFTAPSGTATIDVLSGSNAFHAPATLSSPTVVNVASGAFFSFHNNLGGGASLTKSGAGTMELTGDNDELSGNLFVTAGRLNVGPGMNQIGTGTTTVSGGATLDLNGHSFTNTINLVSGTILNQAIASATTTISGTATVSGVTQGVYDVNAGGVATFASILGTGTATVDVNVNAGGQASFNAAVASLADVVVNTGGTATFADTFSGYVSSHGSSTFNGSFLSQAQVAGTAAFNASTGTGAVINTATSGATSFAGSVAGILTTSGSSYFAPTASLSGALTTAATGIAVFDNASAGAGSSITNNGSLVLSSTGSQSIAAQIGGSGSLVKQGAGLLVLGGTNSSYSGAVTIAGGTVRAGNASALGSGGLALNSGGLDLNGQSLAIGTLSGSAGTSVSSGVSGAARLVSQATGNSTFAGVIANGSGVVGFEKAGAGKLTLTAAQTYTGTTIISGGTLALSSLASLNSAFIKAGAAELDGGTLDVSGLTAGSLAVKNGQTLGGHGTVIGDVVIGGGATLAPGGSIGSLDQVGTLEWASGGNFIFEVTNANGSTPGTSWDLMTADALNITASLGSEFVIQLQSLTNGSDQTPGPLAPGNWNGEQSYSWKFFVADTTITSFDATKFILDTSSFQSLNYTPGLFSLAQGGVGAGRVGGASTDKELYIIYAAVPEPAAIALAAIGVAVAAWGMRRRTAAGRERTP